MIYIFLLESLRKWRSLCSDSLLVIRENNLRFWCCLDIWLWEPNNFHVLHYIHQNAYPFYKMTKSFSSTDENFCREIGIWYNHWRCNSMQCQDQYVRDSWEFFMQKHNDRIPYKLVCVYWQLTHWFWHDTIAECQQLGLSLAISLIFNF